MKKIFFVIILLTLVKAGNTQTAGSKPPILYGIIQKEDLLHDPYLQWFKTGYENYQPDVQVISQLKNKLKRSITIQVFLGTWCGDSKREVPRLLKILDQLSFSPAQLQLIGVGDSDSLLKQSPQHEEAGKGIYRVPTIIIYDKDREINRINEYPCLTLESDLLAILAGRPYTPNYKSFGLIRSWIDDSTLLNKNISVRSFAAQLRSQTEGDHELNSLAHLLLKQGKKEEAMRLFLVNYNLYPESIRVLTSLGEGYSKTGDNRNAVTALERALELNKDPAMIKNILPVLYEARALR